MMMMQQILPAPCLLAVALLSLVFQTGLSVEPCEPDADIPVLEPQFVPSIDRLELLPGDDTSLVCEVYRNVDPEYQPMYGILIWWCNSSYPECHQNRQPLDNLYLSVTTSKAKNASYLRSEFNLTDVVPSQADSYYCVAYSSDQFASKCPGSAKVEVIIQEKSVPKITKHNRQVDVAWGSPFNLTCTANGYPTPSFQWKKDSKPIQGGTTGTYRIDMAGVGDAGMYNCKAGNQFEQSPWSPDIEVKVDNDNPTGLTTLQYVGLIFAAVIFAILLLVVIVRLSKLRSNMTCFTIHKTNIIGNNSTAVHAETVHVYNDSRGSRLSRGDSSHERRTFLHMHDVFIHNHSSDNQFALMIRSKLQDRESHLKVGLWSEVERPDRSSSQNKLLRLRLLNCSRIVIIVSEGYLKCDYHALVSALAKSRAKPESIRSKIIVVRALEEDKIPKEITKDVLTTLEYNVDTDSCYFWPKFMKVAMPDQKEILYWV